MLFENVVKKWDIDNQFITKILNAVISVHGFLFPVYQVTAGELISINQVTIFKKSQFSERGRYRKVAY